MRTSTRRIRGRASAQFARLWLPLAAVSVGCGEVSSDSSQSAAAVDELRAELEDVRQQLEDQLIREDVTVPVAAADGCAGLVDQLATLDERRLQSSATVTIELAPGTYTCDDTIHIRHRTAIGSRSLALAT